MKDGVKNLVPESVDRLLTQTQGVNGYCGRGDSWGPGGEDDNVDKDS